MQALNMVSQLREKKTGPKNGSFINMAQGL